LTTSTAAHTPNPNQTAQPDDTSHSRRSKLQATLITVNLAILALINLTDLANSLGSRPTATRKLIIVPHIHPFWSSCGHSYSVVASSPSSAVFPHSAEAASGLHGVASAWPPASVGHPTSVPGVTSVLEIDVRVAFTGCSSLGATMAGIVDPLCSLPARRLCPLCPRAPSHRDLRALFERHAVLGDERRRHREAARA
jgi:hypothetical protein